jgi:1-acyl-sn-glycerol-3-phosphate acyltransferase
LLWYAFVRGVLAGFCRIFWRLRVVGKHNVPRSGAFILAPVHRSNADTPIVCAVTRRQLHYMGKDSLWRYKWSAWFFTSLGGFPVARGTPDREALRRCEEVLRNGEVLVMFPEGTRQSGPLVGEMFDGVAYLALRRGVPIVPVGIGGSEEAMPVGAKMLRPVKVAVVVGEPIRVDAPPPGERVPRRAVRELTDRLQAELQVLFDEARVVSG